jgi:glucosamine kinase
MDFWQLTTLDLLVEHANSIPPPDFSRLTKLILRAAELGDEVAAEVLRREGEALAYLVRLVVRRLQLEAVNYEWVPPIAFAGSIMEKVPPVRAALIAALRREFGDVRVVARVIDPIAGSIWRARRC